MKQMVLWFGVMAAVVVLGFGCGKKPTEPSGPTVNLATLADSMVLIPAGTFMMGDLSGVSLRNSPTTDERPVHQVTLSPFYMSATECTKKKYYSVMGGSSSENEYTPIDGVSWYMSVRFCNRLSLKEHLTPAYDTSNSDSAKWTCDRTKNGYRLPTEAEWEYACRAGTTWDYYWMPDTTSHAYGSWEEYAWGNLNTPLTNGAQRPMPVAEKLQNAWGLYDMCGNVEEWCNDWYGKYDSTSMTNPMGADSGDSRSIRGESCQNARPSFLTSSTRWMQEPFQITGMLFESIGLRLIRTK